MPARLILSKKIASLFGALAHENRIMIIEELSRGARDVGELSKIIGASHSATSQHLSKLKDLDFIDGEREGKRVVYRLSKDWVADWILKSSQAFEDANDDLKTLLKATQKAKSLWKKP